MLSQSSRALRSCVPRVVRSQYTPTARRALSSTSLRKADIVQDTYLKQLQSYKAPPVKPNDADGHVLKFEIPSAPESPEEADLASSLSEYESQEVQIEGRAEGEAEEILLTPEQRWFEDPEVVDAEEEGESGGH